MALTVLCLLPLAVIGDCRASPEGQTDTNTSGLAPVFPESPVFLDDVCLDGALKIYSPFVLECWELGCRPCRLIDEKIDRTAKKNGVTFFGTGLNPGFLSDSLVLFLTGPMVRVDRIKVYDMQDLTFYNSVALLRDMMGFGLTPE